MSIRIAIIGNLANVGWAIQISLKQVGIVSTLFLSGSELNSPGDPTIVDKDFIKNGNGLFWNLGKVDESRIAEVKYFSPFKLSSNSYTNLCRLIFHIRSNYDVVIGVTLGVIPAYLSGKPYFWFATGSDLRQWIHLNKISSFLLKCSANYCNGIITGTDSGILKSIRRLNLQNKTFFYKTLPITIPKAEDISKSYENEGKLRIFSPSNHIWANLPSFHPGKGNDLLIKAFAKFIKMGYFGELKLLQRGKDWGKSVELINDLEIVSNVVWEKELSRDKLIKNFQRADVIADQFTIGYPGLITIEGMSTGTPVIVYLDENYPDKEIPVINCGSCEQILNALIDCTNKQYRMKVGEKSRLWTKANASFEGFGQWLEKILISKVIMK